MGQPFTGPQTTRSCFGAKPRLIFRQWPLARELDANNWQNAQDQHPGVAGVAWGGLLCIGTPVIVWEVTRKAQLLLAVFFEALRWMASPGFPVNRPRASLQTETAHSHVESDSPRWGVEVEDVNGDGVNGEAHGSEVTASPLADAFLVMLEQFLGCSIVNCKF